MLFMIIERFKDNDMLPIYKQVRDGGRLLPEGLTYQDFDWADEVNHVAYGRQWLIRYFCDGDRKRAEAMADETVAERLAYYQQFAVKATTGY